MWLREPIDENTLGFYCLVYGNALLTWFLLLLPLILLLNSLVKGELSALCASMCFHYRSCVSYNHLLVCLSLTLDFGTYLWRHFFFLSIERPPLLDKDITSIIKNYYCVTTNTNTIYWASARFSNKFSN